VRANQLDSLTIRSRLAKDMVKNT